MTRLIVEMPPRHGKSELISHYAPPWFIGRFGWPVILASYEAEFASSWGGKSRNVIKDHGRAVFGVGLGDKEAANWWSCTNGGEMMTAGVGGAITGKGGRLIIIDDPVKNAEEAQSETYRQRQKDWWDSTARTRLEPDGAIIVMQTRWHEDDLAGYVRTKPEGWKVISLPALADAKDPLGREPGAALFPERYDRDALLNIKANTSSYWWSALYQQSPHADEGAIFKREYWQRYKTLPSPMRGCITVDTAGWEKEKSKGDSDFGVIAVWMTDGVRFYCAHVSRGRWEFPDFTRRVKDIRAKYNVPVVVEETPWARPLIQALKQEVAGVIAWQIEGRSKENRAREVQHYAEGMNLYLPEDAPWVGDFIEEHAAFPTGAHDDQVDTTTMALLYLGKSVPYKPVRLPGGRMVMGR